MSKEKSRSPKTQKAGSKNTPPKKGPKDSPVKDADDQRVKQGDYSDKYSSGRKVS
ncbi:hypothetical protein [Bosea sp. Root483D1]|uniref:hypothetical protein n=1 Tax=Bosea sp. Root483D1 TaxID=1736544 RepID=UPI000B12FB28|nr:hypothetical protein [Bosea sp. Root483D1]